jgi:hypothetical protein
MECTPYPAGAGLAYEPPASPRAWLDTLDASLGLFLFLADRAAAQTAGSASLACRPR